MRESKILMDNANQRGSTSTCYDPSYMQGDGLRAEPTANPYSPWKYVTPLSIVIPYHSLVRNALLFIKTVYGVYRTAPAYAVDKDVVQPVRLHVTFAELLSLECT